MNRKYSLTTIMLFAVMILFMGGCSALLGDLSGADGVDGTNGTNGTDGVDGISIVWKDSSASAPSSPELNWAYYNTVERKSYVWDGTDWKILAQDGEWAIFLPATSDVQLTYGSEPSISIINDGKVDLGYYPYQFDETFTTSLENNSSNYSMQILNLTGNPKIKVLGGEYASNSIDFISDPVPEISIVSITADSLGTTPMDINIVCRSTGLRSGTYRKKYRIQMQDLENTNYYFDFTVEVMGS